MVIQKSPGEISRLPLTNEGDTDCAKARYVIYN